MGKPEFENQDPWDTRLQHAAEARERSPEAPSGDERSTEWAMRFRGGSSAASYGVDVPWSDSGKELPGVGQADVGVKTLWLDIMDRTTDAIGSFVLPGLEVSWGLSLPFDVEASTADPGQPATGSDPPASAGYDSAAGWTDASLQASGPAANESDAPGVGAYDTNADGWGDASMMDETPSGTSGGSGAAAYDTGAEGGSSW
jgi:hypothetical protein